MGQEESKTSRKQERGLAINYLFISGVLALDLLNTEVVIRGKRQDLFSSVEDVARWWSEALSHHPDVDAVKGAVGFTEFTPQIVEAIKTLRVALRNLFTCLIKQHPVKEGDLEVLNKVLAMGNQSLELRPEGEIVPIYQVNDTQQGAIFLPIALSALRLITEGERERLHQCKNDRCILFFYDTTKSGTRHWCSPDCMNRSRSIQHYRQVKAEKILQNSHPHQ